MQLLALAEIDCNCIHFTDALDVSEVRVVLPNLHIAEVSGKGIDSKEKLLAVVAQGLRFPDYFGFNWDATLDCLRDLGWLSPHGYTLVVTDATELWRTCTKEVATFVEIWLSAGSSWRESGVPFHLVFVW